jgi:GT2 family glycosyltransferase
MSLPLVTIINTPRDRFGYARRSLESVYQFTEIPFHLVYVDAGSPKKVQKEIANLRKEKNFEWIRVNHYLPPSVGRNLAAKSVTTPYVVFMDNDCIVSQGWLTALVRCAEETGAVVVSPLICEGDPLHTIVHFSGGQVTLTKKNFNGKEITVLADQNHDTQGQKVADLRPRLKREETGAAEFHCVLMRRDFLEKMGYFDEAVVSKELIDLRLSVLKFGGKMYLEPDALVSFMSEPPLGPPLEPMDIPYYLLRWSDKWELSSLHRLRDKWGLSEDEFFAKRYENLGWRRRMFIVKPFVRRLFFGANNRLIDNLFYKIEARLNPLLVWDYERKKRKGLSQEQRS